MPLSFGFVLRNSANISVSHLSVVTQFPMSLVKARALFLGTATMSSHFQSSPLQMHPLKTCQDYLSKP